MHSNCNRFFPLISNVIFTYFLNNLTYSLILGCAGSSLMPGLSLIVARGADCSLQCAGLSLQRLLLLWSTGSRDVGFSSCTAWSYLFCGKWDLPRPGMEPVSPVLTGRFLPILYHEEAPSLSAFWSHMREFHLSSM